MSTFEPTLFTLAEDISLNEEQQAAQVAFHEVATSISLTIACSVTSMSLQPIIF